MGSAPCRAGRGAATGLAAVAEKPYPLQVRLTGTDSSFFDQSCLFGDLICA